MDELFAILHIKNERNRMLRNNILFSGILKAIALLTSLIIVPITINYLDDEVYGIWLTISSMLFWINTFDIGLGNGMRNYLTKAVSTKNFEMGRVYVSTTFILLSFLALLIAFILIPVYTLNFNSVFNTVKVNNATLRNSLMIAVGFTLINLITKNIGFIFVAFQKYALNDFINTLGSVLGLAIICILSFSCKGNLLYITLAFTGSQTLVYLLSMFLVFHKYPELKPGFKFFNWKIGKQVIGKGIGFFIIQITSCLVIFGASNFFITQFCGPKDVTVYNIAYKYFNLLIIAYSIIISPMWNAYTDAYVKGDIKWIKTTFNKALKIWGASILFGAIMLALSNTFYNLWIGHAVIVPLSVSLCVMIYVTLFNLNNCLTYLINGINKICIQIITSVIITAIYIITILILGKRLGIVGIIGCMATSYAIMAAIHYYQCTLIINNKATGIWNK